MGDKEKNYQLFKQNSELEVLISAAIVFTAFVINDVAGDWIVAVLNLNIPSNSPVLFVVAIAALYMSAILPISLVSHFILRIYWLSLVGLKSVYAKPKDEDVHPKFSDFVNGSLRIERQISALDKICSSIFAFTFLTLFAFLFTFVSISLIVLALQWLKDPYHIGENLSNLVLLFGIFYLIDFLTLGYFKRIKKKWFVRIYYPIYRFFGWITFAALYRGIYYTLIQHASRKVMIFITPLYIFLALVLLNQGYSANILYPENGGYRLEDELIAKESYQDQFVDRMIIESPFIESFVVNAGQNYLKVQIPLTEDLEESILEKCGDVKPFNERGWHWRKWVQTDLNRMKYAESFDYHVNAENILSCISHDSKIKIDSVTFHNPKFLFGTINQPTEFAVLVTMLDISELPRGHHNLILKSEIKSGSITIPFWRD